MNSKETILKATLKLASEKGLGSITLSQIAKKVGIQKTSLYSHFSSKEEIINSLYEYLRETAKNKKEISMNDYGKLVNEQDAYKILHHAVSEYISITTDTDMRMFYRIIISERVFSKEIAKIMIAETEKMIIATKHIFYAMQVHNILHFPDVDMSAISFAMTIHSLIDYQSDKLFAEDNEMGNLIDEYIAYFCKMYQIEADV